MKSQIHSKQEEVLHAFAAGSSVSAAAAAAGLHRTTIHHWSRTIPDFRLAVETARYSRTEIVHEQIADLADLAIDNVRQILQDDKTPIHLRLRAALAVINLITRPSTGKFYTSDSSPVSKSDESDESDEIPAAAPSADTAFSDQPATPDFITRPSTGKFYTSDSSPVSKSDESDEIPAAAPSADTAYTDQPATPDSSPVLKSDESDELDAPAPAPPPEMQQLISNILRHHGLPSGSFPTQSS